MKTKNKQIKVNPSEFSEENPKSQTISDAWKFDFSNYLTACSWMNQAEFASM